MVKKANSNGGSSPTQTSPLPAVGVPPPVDPGPPVSQDDPGLKDLGPYEAIIQALTGGLALPYAAARGLADKAFGATDHEVDDTIRDVADRYTYHPRSTSGQALSGQIGNFMNQVGIPLGPIMAGFARGGAGEPVARPARSSVGRAVANQEGAIPVPGAPDVIDPLPTDVTQGQRALRPDEIAAEQKKMREQAQQGQRQQGLDNFRRGNKPGPGGDTQEPWRRSDGTIDADYFIRDYKKRQPMTPETEKALRDSLDSYNKSKREEYLKNNPSSIVTPGTPDAIDPIPDPTSGERRPREEEYDADARQIGKEMEQGERADRVHDFQEDDWGWPDLGTTKPYRRKEMEDGTGSGPVPRDQPDPGWEPEPEDPWYRNQRQKEGRNPDTGVDDDIPFLGRGSEGMSPAEISQLLARDQPHIQAQDAYRAVNPATGLDTTPQSPSDLIDNAFGGSDLTRGFGRTQRGAIRVGGDPDLILHHNMRNGELITGHAPSELYNPSFAITNLRNPQGKTLLDEFGGGRDAGAWLVPRIGAFSPTSTPSTLFNRDAYTYRYGSATGRRFDSIPYDVTDPDLSSDLSVDAEGRLLDRGLIPPHPLGQQPSYLPAGSRFGEMVPGDLGHALSILSSKRFPSFRAFEADPAGAARLTALGSDTQYSQGLASDARRLIAGLGQTHPEALQGLRTSDPAQVRSILADMASGKFGTTPDFNYLTTSRSILRGLARVPSDYAELKTFGPVGINPDNFAGAVVTTGHKNIDVGRLKSYLQDRWRIPVETFDTYDGPTPSRSQLAETVQDIGFAAPPKKSNEPGSRTVVPVNWPPNPKTALGPEATDPRLGVEPAWMAGLGSTNMVKKGPFKVPAPDAPAVSTDSLSPIDNWQKAWDAHQAPPPAPFGITQDQWGNTLWNGSHIPNIVGDLDGSPIANTYKMLADQSHAIKKKAFLENWLADPNTNAGIKPSLQSGIDFINKILDFHEENFDPGTPQ